MYMVVTDFLRACLIDALEATICTFLLFQVLVSYLFSFVVLLGVDQEHLFVSLNAFNLSSPLFDALERLTLVLCDANKEQVSTFVNFFSLVQLAIITASVMNFKTYSHFLKLIFVFVAKSSLTFVDIQNSWLVHVSERVLQVVCYETRFPDCSVSNYNHLNLLWSFICYLLAFHSSKWLFKTYCRIIIVVLYWHRVLSNQTIIKLTEGLLGHVNLFLWSFDLLYVFYCN